MKGISMVSVTDSALELMSQQNALTKDLLGAIQVFREDLCEFKKTIRKPILFNEEEAAEYIGMSVHFLRKSRSEGKIGDRTPPPGHLEIGGSIRYEKKELDRWIAEDLPRKHYSKQKGGN